MRICTHCGHPNRSGDAACRSCGTRLEGAPHSHSGLAGDSKALIGRVLNGKYEVLKVLGEGGMGVVYQVRHLLLKNRNLFALKILHPRFSSDKDFQERFLREVEVAMELTHENIVQIRDFGLTEDEFLFFTMDFFPGDTLKDVLKRDGPFPAPRAAAIARSVLLALVEAHRIGVVHRDLKPDNILIAPGKHGDAVRILDFGIAKLLGDDATSRTLTLGGVIGTPRYMSPEQAAGEAVDARSDLYSLGTVLYEMLAGQTPFSKGTARQLVMAQISTPPPPFGKARPEIRVPARLDRLVFRLLAKDRDRRPASARECLALLEGTGVLPRAGARVAAAARGVERGRPRTSRRRVLVALLLGGAVLPAAFVAWKDSAGRVARAGGGPLPEGARDASALPAPVPGSAGGPAPVESGGPRTLRLFCDVCKRSYAPEDRPGRMCCFLPLRDVSAAAEAAPDGPGRPAGDGGAGASLDASRRARRLPPRLRRMLEERLRRERLERR